MSADVYLPKSTHQIRITGHSLSSLNETRLWAVLLVTETARGQKSEIVVGFFAFFCCFFPFVLSSIMAAELESEYFLCQTDLLCQGKLYECKNPLDAHQLPIYLFLLQYVIMPNRTRDKERGRAKKKKQNRNRKRQIMKNQTTSCYTCKNKTEDNPRPLWGIQP